MNAARAVLFVLLFALPLAARPPWKPLPPVKLKDGDRFAPVLAQDLEHCQQLAIYFSEYTLFEQRQLMPQADKTSQVYGMLRAFKFNAASADDRIANLAVLQFLLGEEAYAKGRVPTPYEPNYKEPFRAWLRKKGYPIEP